MKSAIIFGSTGLVGGYLLKQLIEDNTFSKIKIFTRSDINIKNEKLEIFKSDLRNSDILKKNIDGDVCFFCIGTTKHQTPDKDEYRRIEYELPYEIGKISKLKNIKSFVYISSLGANSKSGNFYLKNKGDAENSLKDLNFNHLAIIRPSFMIGHRKLFRLGEFIIQKIFTSLSFLFIGPLKKYKSIRAEQVSHAMISIYKNNLKGLYFESDQLQKL